MISFVLSRKSTSRLLAALCLLAGVSACTSDDSSSREEIPTLQLSFKAFDSEAKSIPIEAYGEWSFRISGDTELCDVERNTEQNRLIVTPNINYDTTIREARIDIETDGETLQTITVSQQANAETYLKFLNSELAGDNPILTVDSDPEDGTSRCVILVETNNRLSIRLSENQELPDEESSAASDETTRTAIEGCDWITYEADEVRTDNGTIQTLTLTCASNRENRQSRTAFLEIVSGAGTQNTLVTKRIGITQLADMPSIVVNAPSEGLVATYDQREALTFSVAANLEYDYAWVSSEPEWATLTETTSGEESAVRNFSIRVEPWTGLANREASLEFVAREGADVARSELRLIQTAAPQAFLSLETSDVIFEVGEESSPKYVNVTCSFSTMEISTTVSESGAAVSWLEVSYQPAEGRLALQPTESARQDRRAVITLRCGGGDNEASTQMTVTQKGPEALLELDPERVDLDPEGSRQVITVITNQESWELLDAADNPAFTLTEDHARNTITVSAGSFGGGVREHTYTVRAGTLEKQFVVSQSAPYKVGAPYLVNGRPVGIVYQVDETGMHGKAYALTVYNLIDKYFMYTAASGFQLEEVYAPLSRTDGLENQRLLMSIPGWETICQMTKWTHDLGQRQGVEWYIPAIEELMEMVEAMSGAEYGRQPGASYDTLPPVTEVNEAWNVVRGLYKQYTTPENGYDQEQYVVFQWANDDYTEKLDGRQESIYNGWTLQTPGDEMAERWFSSTVELSQGIYHSYTIQFGRDPRGNGVVNNDCVTEATAESMEAYAGSIHPICRF